MANLKFAIGVASILLLLPTVGNAQTISDASVSAVLAQFGSSDNTVRRDAFFTLLNLGARAAPSATPYSISAQMLSVLQNVSAGSANQIDLSLIDLLTLENSNIAPAYQPTTSQASLTADYADYYAGLVEAVAALKDPRSIGSLVGALRSGDIASSALAAFGDAAIDALLQQLSDSDVVFQFSTVFAMEEMLEPGTFANISASTKAKLHQGFTQALRSAGPEVVSEAAQALAKLNSLADTILPASLTFGGQLVSTASSTQTLTLSNTLTAPLTVTSIGVAGTNAVDFSQTNTCGTNLAAGANCTINVKFAPAAAGSRTGSLSVVLDGVQSLQTVALSGNGTDFSLGPTSGAPTSATLTAGQTAALNLQVNPISGFTGSTSLACTGAPPQATCTASPSSVSVAGASAAPFTVTVATTARSLASGGTSGRSSHGGRNLTIFLGASFSLLAGCLISTRRRTRSRWTYLLMPVLLVSIITGCGGGGTGNGSGGGGVGSSGTPAGTYTLTVTGSQQGVNRSATLVLTVN